jgi:hypothetical protein
MKLIRRDGIRFVALMFLVAQVGLGAAWLFDAPTVQAAGGPTGQRIFNLNGDWARGSVALGDLNGDGVDDAVVGTIDGKVHAFDIRNERTIWTYDTGNAAIEGKAAIGDINNDGHNEVIIGVGSTFTPGAPGGIWAFSHDGTLLWRRYSGDFDENGVADGVYSTPALADIDGNDGGKLEIVYGSWDGHIRALNHNGTLVWEVFTRDTIWSSPAMADIDRDGLLEVVIGSDAHWEPAFGTIDGGKIYALNAEDGSLVPGFFRQVDEVVWSSPALGDVNRDGWLDIIVGTGDCYEHSACASGGRTHTVTDALYGWDYQGNQLPGWHVSLSEYAFASPSMGDLDGDGDIEIVVNTGDGYMHAFNGDGTVVAGWPRLVTTLGGYHFASRASPVLADLTGDGNLEVILPSNWEVVVWNRQGQQLTQPLGTWNLGTEYTVYGTPAVGDVDGDGKVELIVAGARSGASRGALYVWDFDQTLSEGLTPWSCFRRDDLNHAHFPIAPVMAASSPSVLVMSEPGGGSVSSSLRIVNAGGGEITWQVTQTPANVIVTPGSGIVDWTGAYLELTVSTSGYAEGTHSLGNIQIEGLLDGETVEGSPLSIPITLYVGDVHRVFLPMITRGSR